jgi:transcriptional regulator GlxA family with amidase domain
MDLITADALLDRPISAVGFLLIPGFSLMSYASAIEPLRAANMIAGRDVYRWHHFAPSDRPAPASTGAPIVPDHSLGMEGGDLDLLLLCAGGNPATFKDRATFAWLRKLARQAVTIGGISGGPFVLAQAGLLDGRRCTIHWEHLPAFEEMFPRVTVTRSLFELDGNRITCSGGIAVLDMMIALIRRDHGHEFAAAVGDWFLHTHVREGFGPQRMDMRFRLGVTDEKMLAVLRAIEASLERPIPRDELAKIAGGSLRQLERSFRARLGKGVHEHYLSLRLMRARQLLRESDMNVTDIAIATGFGSTAHFSKAFRSAFGMSPSAARSRERGATP